MLFFDRRIPDSPSMSPTSKQMDPKKTPQAWIVSVDMGYGHQRAAYPMKDIAFERIITANSDKIISQRERKIWFRSRLFYEFISRLKSIPFVGKAIFGIYDKLQTISPFFPFRDLSKPNFAVLYTKYLIGRGLCKSLINYVQRERMPFVTTHFIPALAAHYLGLKQHVYCIVTDTDINRVWVPDKPKDCRITYLVPSRHAAMRLKQYGVSDERMNLTGFPLPKENIGGRNRSKLKRCLGDRLPNLDPKRVFISKYSDHIKNHLGAKSLRKKSSHPLTITYVVGGAGAQRDIGTKIIKALRERILKKELRVNLAAGTRLDVMSYFSEHLELLGMKDELGSGVNVILALDKKTYFSTFNEALRTTDILWTKPSELSFYTALGLPVIIAPPVGAHENYNREWLEHIGSGFVQEDPEYVNDWLFYILESGRYAEAAWNGFMDAPNLGTYNIEDIVLQGAGAICTQKGQSEERQAERLHQLPNVNG